MKKFIFIFLAIGACWSKPCQNNGMCVDDKNGNYECNCAINWEGKNCEKPIRKFNYLSLTN